MRPTKFFHWLGATLPLLRPLLMHPRIRSLWLEPLPTTDQYWQLLLSFDWHSFGMERRGEWQSTKAWDERFGSIYSRIERFALRSPDLEELACSFLIAAENDTTFPSRPS